VLPPAGTATGIDFVHEYAVAADRFATAVAGCDLRAPVPSCPGWTAYDLTVHLGNVHAWAATIVETGNAAVEQNDEPSSRRHTAVSEWYLGKAGDLFAVLRSARPDAPCWTFGIGQFTASFWPRRQLHETTIHLVDLDLAAGRPSEVSTELSVDGIAEALSVFLPRMHRRGHPAALTAPISLVAEDTGRAWTVTPRPAPPSSAPAPSDTSPIVVDRLHPQADRVSAPADVLYRLLWKRYPVDDPAVTLTGDRERLDAFLCSRLVP
jgi:uncharacterized protein (TIGR03083 family)